MKKILITGASGFLGSQFVKKYSDEGWQVITLGRSKSNDIVVDLSNLNSIQDITLPEGVSRVIHCAAVNEVHIKESVVDTYSVNVTFTRVLAEMCIKNNLEEFIYISTFHVYGVESGDVSDKTPIRPLNDYGLTHYLSEEILRTILLQRSNIKLKILRPTNIYGWPIDILSFNRWTLIPFDFVRCALQDKQIVLKTPGGQYRNFVDVNDVIKNSDFVNPYQILDIYGNDNLSIKSFANLVACKIGEKLKCDIAVLAPEASGVAQKLPLSFSRSGFEPNGRLEVFIDRFSDLLQKRGCDE